MSRIVVAMSGGVDSTVAASLLLEQGHEVIGVTMNLWCDPAAPATADGMAAVVAEGRRAAQQLGIEFHALDLQESFREQIVNDFCSEYQRGRTPNPCALCNKQIKFGQLLDFSWQLGADSLATGHYARLTEKDGWRQICKGLDPKKDQSYFLFSLDQDKLKRICFPLGELSKPQVREKAIQLGLDVAEKAESQDICFVPDGDYARFLHDHCQVQAQPGAIVHINGQQLGRHQGIWHYTIGQRKGLGIGWSEPLYVITIDADKQRIVVGEKCHLDQTELWLENCNWNLPLTAEPLQLHCRLRYRHQEAPADVWPLADGRARVVFHQPQKGVTPGQVAVFYQQERVVGGGWIA